MWRAMQPGDHWRIHSKTKIGPFCWCYFMLSYPTIPLPYLVVEEGTFTPWLLSPLLLMKLSLSPGISHHGKQWSNGLNFSCLILLFYDIPFCSDTACYNISVIIREESFPCNPEAWLWLHNIKGHFWDIDPTEKLALNKDNRFTANSHKCISYNECTDKQWSNIRKIINDFYYTSLWTITIKSI